MASVDTAFLTLPRLLPHVLLLAVRPLCGSGPAPTPRAPSVPCPPGPPGRADIHLQLQVEGVARPQAGADPVALAMAPEAPRPARGPLHARPTVALGTQALASSHISG